MYNATRLRGLGVACSPQYLDYKCVYCCDPQPATTSTPTQPVSTDARTKCEALFQLWINANPQYNACLTHADRDAIVNQCIAWQTGRTTQANAEIVKAQIISKSCKALFRTQCEQQYQLWAQQNPAIAQCVSSTTKEQLIQLCIQGKIENWSADKSAAAAQQVLKGVVCPTPTPQPPAPVTPPATTAVTTPQPPLPPDPYVEPGDNWPQGGSGDPYGPIDGGDELSRQPQSALRKWGPILGVGLLIAGGIYMVGHKPKKKPARRRAA